MPTRTEHKHGSFSWAELATTDADAAKKFYGPLFGWKFNDTPAGDMTYTMNLLGDQAASALYKMGAEMKGMPPHWACYISVDDVDATTKKASANGGKVMKEPFDVMEFGRMSVIQDPSGAALCLWQAKKHIGAGVVNEPGAITWLELYTNNTDACGKFYAQTIGWRTEAHDMGPMGTYTMFYRPTEAKEGGVGGMMNMPPNMKGVPPHWLAYFAVTDCDASAKKAQELGGSLLMPPTDIPNIGRFAIVKDPQGAVFAIYKNEH
ncbi:MAG: VOC family protein [Polyangiaceae bacterium]|nr:VOC family protein [Polyangiaceae bacterium]